MYLRKHANTCIHSPNSLLQHTPPFSKKKKKWRLSKEKKKAKEKKQDFKKQENITAMHQYNTVLAVCTLHEEPVI